MLDSRLKTGKKLVLLCAFILTLLYYILYISYAAHTQLRWLCGYIIVVAYLCGLICLFWLTDSSYEATLQSCFLYTLLHTTFFCLSSPLRRLNAKVYLATFGAVPLSVYYRHITHSSSSQKYECPCVL